MGFFFLWSCGLPSLDSVVPEASGISVNGDYVSFVLTESSGFFLHYRFYPGGVTVETNFSNIASVGEDAIFAALGHHKAYAPPASARRRFIWQPSATDVAPYSVILKMNDGYLEVRDNASQLIFTEHLFRNTPPNLLEFKDFQSRDRDMPPNVGSTAELAWAVMNTRLDPTIFVLNLSHATYLGHVNGVTVS